MDRFLFKGVGYSPAKQLEAEKLTFDHIKRLVGGGMADVFTVTDGKGTYIDIWFNDSYFEKGDRSMDTEFPSLALPGEGGLFYGDVILCGFDKQGYPRGLSEKEQRLAEATLAISRVEILRREQKKAENKPFESEEME